MNVAGESVAVAVAAAAGPWHDQRPVEQDLDESPPASASRWLNHGGEARVLRLPARPVSEPETLPTLRQIAASLGRTPYDLRIEGKPMFGKPTVATVPPNFTVRLDAIGSDAKRPSAFNKARSLAASTRTTLASIRSGARDQTNLRRILDDVIIGNQITIARDEKSRAGEFWPSYTFSRMNCQYGLGHRVSEDFDFFSSSGFEPARLRLRLPFFWTWTRPTRTSGCTPSAATWRPS